MLSSNLSWHFFARGNQVYKTRFIYRVLESQFLCDVSIHVEITDLWVPPGNRFSETRFLIGFFQKIKGNVNASHSRTVLRHSLSLTLPLTPPFSTLCHSPSHASVTAPPSHPLTLSRASPPSHLSCSLLSHSDGSLTHPLHCQSVWWC